MNVAAMSAPIRRATHPFINTGGGSYATPDIKDNMSFETNYDGFTDGGLSNPPSVNVSRSTDRAYAGTTSLKFAWNNNAGDQGAEVFYNIGAGRTHVFSRMWFYIATAWPNGSGFKFFRYQDASLGGITGIQALNGNLCWVDSVSNIIYAQALPSVDTWHSCEWELDLDNRAGRLWIDGAAQTWSSKWQDPNNRYTLNGTTLNWTALGEVITPRYADICRVINPTTNAGTLYVDRVAFSTERIGP